MTDAQAFADLELEDTEKTNIDLVALDALCVKMLAADGEVQRLTEQLKKATQDYNKLAEQEIPEMMLAGGLTELRRADGSIIKISDDLFTNIPKIRAEEIYAEVAARGGADMIKNELSIALDKGQDELAAKVEAFAKELALNVERSKTIHASTYKKWIKTQLTSDKPIDLAFFGAYKKTTAKLVQ